MAKMAEMKAAAEAMSGAHSAGAQDTSANINKTTEALKKEATALQDVTRNSDQYNKQVAWQGASSEGQFLSNLQKEGEYRRLLNIQLQRGFFSPQQAFSFRQQELAQALLWNRASQQGYQAPEQYLGYLSNLRAAQALENVGWASRAVLLKQATDAQLGYVNSLRGTHESIGQLAGTAAQAQAAVASLGAQDTTASAGLEDSQLRAGVAIDIGIIGALGNLVAKPKVELDGAAEVITGVAAIEAAMARLSAARAAYGTAIPVAGPTGNIGTRVLTGGTNAGAGPPATTSAADTFDYAAVRAANAARQLGDADAIAAAGANRLADSFLNAGLSAEEAASKLGLMASSSKDAASRALYVAAAFEVQRRSTQAIADSAAEAQAELYQLGTAQAEPVIKLNDDDFLSRITRDMAMLSAAREQLAITQGSASRFVTSAAGDTQDVGRRPIAAITAGPQRVIAPPQYVGRSSFATSSTGTTFTNVKDTTAYASRQDAAAFDAAASASRDASRRVMADAADEAKAYQNAALVEAIAAKNAADARVDEASRAAGEAIASFEAAQEVYRAASQNTADALSAPLTEEAAQAALTADRIKSLADAQMTEAQRVAAAQIDEAERAADAQEAAAAKVKAAWDAVYASEAGNIARQKAIEDAAAADQAARDESAARQKQFLDDQAAARAAREAAVRELADQAAARAAYSQARADAAAMLASLGNGAAAERAAAQLENMAHASDDATQSSHFMWAAQVAGRIATSQLSDDVKKSAADFITLAAAQRSGADAAHRAYDAQVALARATRDAGGAAVIAAAAAGGAGRGGIRTPFFFLPRGPDLPLFNGAIASPAFMNSMSALMLAFHLLIDFILVAVPAAITMLYGLTAFAVGAAHTVVVIADQMKNLSTVSTALGKNIPPVTDALDKLEAAVKPQTMQLFGEALVYLNNQAAKNTFTDWAVKTGTYLDKLGARFVAFSITNNAAFKAFLDEGGHYLAMFGAMFDAIFNIFSVLAKGGQITHVAEGVLAAWMIVFQVLAKVMNFIGPIGTAAVIAFFALVHYGGLIATMAQVSVEWLLTLASKLPGVSALAATLSQKLGLSNDALVNMGKNTAKMDAVANSLLMGERNAAAMGTALVGSEANLAKVVARTPEVERVAGAFKLSAEQVAANAIAFSKLPGGIEAAARASQNLTPALETNIGKLDGLAKNAALLGVASVNSGTEAEAGFGRFAAAAESAGTKTSIFGKLLSSVGGFMASNWVIFAAAAAVGLGIFIDKIITGTNATQAFYDKTQSLITGSSIQGFTANVQTAIGTTTKLADSSLAQWNSAKAALSSYQKILGQGTSPTTNYNAQLAQARTLSTSQAQYQAAVQSLAAEQAKAASAGSQQTEQQLAHEAALQRAVQTTGAVYHGYQTDLVAYQKEQTAWGQSLSSIMRATGTDSKGALALITEAGVTTSQMLDTNKQHLLATQIQVEATQKAYDAMALGSGRAASALNALNYQQGQNDGSLGALDIQYAKFISANDALQTTLLGSETAFTSVTSAIHTTMLDANVAGASMSGLNDKSLKLSTDFYGTLLPAMQKQNDALQMQNISTKNLTTVTAAQVAYALPFAKGNTAARDTLVSFINQALGPSTVSLKTLDGWVRTNGTSLQGWKNIVDQSTISAEGFAGTLGTTLANQLATQVIQFTGAGLAQQNYAKDLLAGTQATQQGQSDRWHLITDLMNAGMSAKNASSFVDSLTRKLEKVPPKVTATVSAKLDTPAMSAALKAAANSAKSRGDIKIPVSIETPGQAKAAAMERQLAGSIKAVTVPVGIQTPGQAKAAAMERQLISDFKPIHIPATIDTPTMGTSGAAADIVGHFLGILKGGAATPKPVKIGVDTSQITASLTAVQAQITKDLAPPSVAAWTAFFNAITAAFASSVAAAISKFLQTTLAGLLAQAGASWKSTWATGWANFNTSIVSNLTKLFKSQFPSWFSTLGTQWKSLWTTGYTDFQTAIQTPVNDWFTKSLPSAIEGAFRLSMDAVITGPIDSIVNWINSISASTGIKTIQGPATFAAGGGFASVGGSGDFDSQDAKVMPGEWIIRKSARMALQAAYGPDFLPGLNQADTWLGSGSRGTRASQGYASGGAVDPSNFGAAWKQNAGADLSSLVPGAGMAANVGLSVASLLRADILKDITSAVAATGAAGPVGTQFAANQALGQKMAAARGWTGPLWNDVNYVEMREAGWNPRAVNPTSGAYGIAQGITGPGWYAGEGGNSGTVAGQITGFYNYMQQRYNGPAGAAAHEKADNWYASGGDVGYPPGLMGKYASGGSVAANHMLSFFNSKIGHPYSENTSLRLGPQYYDCSGLMYRAAQAAGIQIPLSDSTASAEAEWLVKNRQGQFLGSKNEVARGDLLFMTGAVPHPTPYGGIGHTGMALSRNEMVSALGTAYGVTDSPIYNFVMGLRLPGSGSAAGGSKKRKPIVIQPHLLNSQDKKYPGPAPWGNVLNVARETQITEHNMWARFLAKVQSANANKRLPANDQQWLRGLDHTQAEEEKLVAKTIAEAQRWNSHLSEVSEAPGPMDRLFREAQSYVASYDKHLLAQPYVMAGSGKKRHKVPTGWRALAGLDSSGYASLEQSVRGMEVPLASLSDMWNKLRYPGEPDLGHLPDHKFRDPAAHLQQMKHVPPASYAAGGLTGQLSFMPHAMGGSIGTPDLSGLSKASGGVIAPSVRSEAAQATSGPGTGGATVTFGDINIHNPIPQRAGESLTGATQRAAWLAGRAL